MKEDSTNKESQAIHNAFVSVSPEQREGGSRSRCARYVIKNEALQQTC